MRKKHFLFVLAVLCLYYTAFAQQITPLRVGDTLPEVFWKTSHAVFQNGKLTNKSLESYAGRPLLLDFWASWCTTCLKKFPLLDSASRELGLPVMLINSKDTGDTQEKIYRALIENMKSSLPSVVSDTLMRQYFPGHSLPHYVWIDASGRVQAITGSVPVNRQSLKEMAKEKKKVKK